jgi:hypothetical protein
MISHVNAAFAASIVAGGLSFFACSVSLADGGSVSILSTNTLSSGSRAIDYHPLLTIECKAGPEPVLSQSIRIRDSVSGSGTIDISVRADNGAEVSEQWTLASNSRGFSTQGDRVAKRLSAKRLRFSWRIGLFSGRGEAIFDLTDSSEALAAIAANCAGKQS